MRPFAEGKYHLRGTLGPASRLNFTSSTGQNRDEEPEEEGIQSHWLSMESRVTRRRTKLAGEGPSGRSAVPKSEEDMWLEAGVYDSTSPNSTEKK